MEPVTTVWAILHERPSQHPPVERPWRMLVHPKRRHKIGGTPLRWRARWRALEDRFSRQAEALMVSHGCRVSPGDTMLVSGVLSVVYGPKLVQLCSGLQLGDGSIAWTRGGG